MASLNSANLSRADLRRARLNEAVFSDAKLTHADLREVTGLSCDQLKQAQDWETTYRDAELACGAAIPEFDASTTEDIDDAPRATAAKITSPSPTEGLELKKRIVTERATLVELSRLIVEQTHINITALRNERLNSPEANEVINRLEGTLSTAQELVEGLGAGGAAGGNRRSDKITSE